MASCRAHKNSSSTTLYVAVTSGDVLGEGRDNAPRREEHLRNANLHHEFSIRVTPRLAPAAAAKRVRRFQHHSMASGTSDAAGGDLDSGTAAGGLLAGTGLVDGVVQSPRSKREDAILVGPEFEFVRARRTLVHACVPLLTQVASLCVLPVAMGCRSGSVRRRCGLIVSH